MTGPGLEAVSKPKSHHPPLSPGTPGERGKFAAEVLKQLLRVRSSQPVTKGITRRTLNEDQEIRSE